MKGGGEKEQVGQREIALPHLHHPSTVLHSICLLAQLRNCVPAKWSERGCCGVLDAGGKARMTDGQRKRHSERRTVDREVAAAGRPRAHGGTPALKHPPKNIHFCNEAPTAVQ